MLGILKADAIYVPLDPLDSPERLAAAVRACQPTCLLTAGSAAATVEAMLRSGGIGSTIVGSLERTPIELGSFSTTFCMTDVAKVSDRAVASRNRPTNPALLVFSGKGAGMPRGVVTTHASMARSVAWAIAHFDIRPGDRHALTSAPARERSSYEAVVALAAGATIVLTAPEVAPHPRFMANFLRREQLTQWGATTEALILMAEADVVAPGDFPLLRQVIWRGGALPVPVLQYWTRRVGHAGFTSLYGAPGATIASAYHTWRQDIVADSTLVPIGTACPGQEVLVLSDRLEATEAGETGDLWIRGAGVSPGYWGDSAATVVAFRRGLDGPTGNDRMCRTGDRGRRGRDGQIHVVVSEHDLRQDAGPSLAQGEAIEPGVRA